MASLCDSDSYFCVMWKMGDFRHQEERKGLPFILLSKSTVWPKPTGGWKKVKQKWHAGRGPGYLDAGVRLKSKPSLNRQDRTASVETQHTPQQWEPKPGFQLKSWLPGKHVEAKILHSSKMCPKKRDPVHHSNTVTIPATKRCEKHRPCSNVASTVMLEACPPELQGTVGSLAILRSLVFSHFRVLLLGLYLELGVNLLSRNLSVLNYD